MGPLEVHLVDMREELVALSQRRAAVAEEIYLWLEKRVALHSDVSLPAPWLGGRAP